MHQWNRFLSILSDLGIRGTR